jgi:hypothetical protein
MNTLGKYTPMTDELIDRWNARLPHIKLAHGYWICITNMRMFPSLSDKASAWCAARNSKP